MKKYIEDLIKRYPKLEIVSESILQAYKLLEEGYKGGGKLLVAGNGGSASDAEHIVGELMKGFVLSRKIDDELRSSLIEADEIIGTELAEGLQGALPAIALCGHNSLSTAILNDINGTIGFAQQLHGYGRQGDVFLGISTSGNSKNILQAAVVAKAKGIKVIGLTGESGGKLLDYADVIIKIPEKETHKIQELHLPVYHCLCIMLEERFFGHG